MNNKFLLLPVILAMQAPGAVRALEGFYLETMTAGDIKNLPAPALPDKKPEEKKWTVMVYMNGKSNVEQFALADMNELESVGSTDTVNVVVELGRMRGQDGDTAADGDWTGSRRYLVQKDEDPSLITSPVLMEMKNTDMGDYKSAVDFVRWAKEKFPAKRYMLVIWDHGWGWIDPGKGSAWKTKEISIRSISHDFETGNYIKTVEMGKLLREAGGVDVYASMACFMQMMEVAYEIKDHARVIVGSEEVIQLPSFDFGAILSSLSADPSALPEKAGEILVDTFHDLYTSPDILDQLTKAKYGVQLSAIRAGALAALREKLDEWVRLAIELNDTAAVKAAKEGVLRFEVGDETTDPLKRISFYGDLYNFMEIFSRSITVSGPGALELKSRSAKIMDLISRRLVVKNTYVGKDRTEKDYSNTHGIAVHIPGEPGHLIDYVNRYGDLVFGRESEWAGFIKYAQKVR